MAFGLTIGTERAAALQLSIQDELIKRGFSPDADPVMAEYITIMVINNKTASQITGELEDLIGSDFDNSFTEWLFSEAAKGAPESDAPVPPVPSASDAPIGPAPSREIPPHLPNDSSRRIPNAPRNGIYQQAISQALPSTSPSAQKRTASARSPSPTHPNKSRRTDVPTGPRAMLRDGTSAPAPNSRSLLDRVGGPAGSARNNSGPGGFHDDIQARIDTIVNNSPDPNMMMGGYSGMGPMDMNMNAAGISSPLMLQEMMMNQMAMMAQMASSMGMMNGAGQFTGPGFPMQGVMPGDMGMFQNSGVNNGGFQGPGGNVGNGGANRGRGSGRGARGSSRGRGGGPSTSVTKSTESPHSNDTTTIPNGLPVASPIPTTPAVAVEATAIPPTAAPQRLGFVLPERPQSPTLCKFGLKCTNGHCRYSHPSPVATAESGVVLSNEACEKGKDCKDKDCIKAHVSPAVLNPQALETPAPATPQTHTQNHHPNMAAVPCRFGAACTRPGCSFIHPSRPATNHFAQQCRFGAGCTRATCPFQHPEGRVLPTTFHRGLATTAPLVNVSTPETGSMGGPSPHRSMTFNNAAGSGAGVKEKLQQQMREIQEKKSEAEKAVKEAEAAASKKDESKPVAITA
ncbi:hypothetical protein BD779DRAFT_1513106 [Infundibulicybe gibba]|nr:hypothetical protein BD779DRAFT_1513106 [Infundibulicybe gibba]